LQNLLLFIKKRLILISAILLLCLSVFFAYTIFKSMDYFNLNKQTIVGTIYLENIEESQYTSFITSEIRDWKNKSTYKVTYQGFELEIDLDYFVLDITDTISSIKKGQSSEVQFSITDSSKALLLAEFANAFSSDIIDSLLYDTFVDTLTSHMEKMNIFKIYNLENYLEDSLGASVIDSVTIDNINSVDVDNITALVSTVNIDQNARFSLLEALTDYTLTNTQLSIIASGIQNVTTSTPFFGYIYTQNTNLPTWGEEGINVSVLKTNNFDFSFFNPLEFDYLINIAKVSDTSISIELVGYPFSTKYSVTSIENIVLQYDTVYHEDETIDETTVNVIIIDEEEDMIYRLLEEPGVDGKIISWVRTSTNPDLTITTEILYIETYYPTSEIYQENIVPKVGE